jgi:hypothetical protein
MTSSPNIAVNTTRLIFNAVQGGAASTAQHVTISNTGDADLTIPETGLVLSGTDATEFQLTNAPTLPLTLAAGTSIEAEITFNPTTTGPKSGLLQLQSNDPDMPQLGVDLRGLSVQGLGGSNEPSLQWILDTYQIPLNVGDPEPNNNLLPTTSPLGDEVIVPRFQKADVGAVTVEPLAVFGPQDASGIVTRFGYYTSGNAASKQELFTVDNTNYQSLNLSVSGSLSFDPGSESFGFYSIWPFFGDREVYSEDNLNTFEGAIPHHVRVYPLKKADGTEVSNAYILATEEHTSGFDYQDIVLIVRNVKPAIPTPPQIEIENLDGVPFRDGLVFSRVQKPGPERGFNKVEVHDKAKLLVKNTGTRPLAIAELQIEGPWKISSLIALPSKVAVTAPLEIPEQGMLEIEVEFVATNSDHSSAMVVRPASSTNPTIAIHKGKLTIKHDNASEVVELSGLWQRQSEGSNEPLLKEIVKVFGYGTVIVGSGQKLSNRGKVEAVGDEVVSTYWERATSDPVTLVQLAAFHGRDTSARISWYGEGSNTPILIFKHKESDAQTLLPREDGGTGRVPIKGKKFIPTSPKFGFNIHGVWSDPDRNRKIQEGKKIKDGGHHIRFWQAKDREGREIPNTFIVAMDYLGSSDSPPNLDYNDNVFLISNIKPAS